ncbi:MAG: T9SS type A sorting domain-containing protein [Saprospiraceae bacterium]|nr:T9SS type A sorting domain-containing protein [Saprospiraceae bacterium]
MNTLGVSKQWLLPLGLMCCLLLGTVGPATAQFHIPVQQTNVKSHLLVADTVWMGTGNGVVKMLRNGQLLGRWTQDDFSGFPPNAPTAMSLDNTGRLLVYYDFWGIRRYDGVQWETLTDPFTPVIGNLSFIDITTDTQNRIVLGGGSIMYRQQGSGWEAISTPFSSQSRMKRGPDGHIWVITNQFLARLDNTVWATSQAALPNRQYGFDFTWNAAGDLFAIFYAQNSQIPEIWKFPQGNLQQPELVVSIPEYAQSVVQNIFFAESIAIDAQDRIWLQIAGPSFNFIRRDGNTWTELGGILNSPFPEFEYPEARMTPDPDGSMWISSRTHPDPLYRYADDTGWQVYENSFLEMGYAGAAGLDGKVFFGGLRFMGYYDPATGQYRHQSLGAEWPVVHDMAVSPFDGIVYAATETGVWEFDGQDWSVSAPVDDPTAHGLNIAVAPDNSVWALIATSNGQTIQNHLMRRPPGGDWQGFVLPRTASGLTIAPDTAVWLAVFDQVYRYKNGQLTVFDANTVGYPFTELNGTLLEIHVDKQGVVWLFVPGAGLARYDGTAWTVLTPENSGLYATYNLRDMAFDASGRLWLAFSNGGSALRNLQVYDGYLWKNYTSYNSNTGDYAIEKIVSASNGGVWLHDTYSFYYFEPFPRFLRGNALRDTNENCFPDLLEPSLPQWIARATAPDGQKWYTITDPNGYYELPLDSSLYQIDLLPPAVVWGNCDASPNIDLTQTLADTLDFSGEVLAECPLMQVEIDVPFLRRCFPNIYQIRYCNFGTAPAANAAIDLRLPAGLALQNLELPYTEVSVGHIRVNLGQVDDGACGDFSMTVVPDCALELGETLCVSAHITPDTLCMGSPGWSGADLQAEASCTSDTAYFVLRNRGFGNMAEEQDYVIIEDEVIMRIVPVQIPMGDSVLVPFPISSGYQRIQIPQEPGHPFPGLVSAFVAGCNGSSGNSFVTQYPFDQPSPFYAQTCTVLKGAYDPNDKSATPEGVKAEHYIWPRTPIDYKIRFQNTGTDTAFTVAIRDTLSPWLDVATFRPGASSHPYQWDISGNGILTFVFNNIMLPDSNVNEAASHGFVAFNIAPADTTPLGTVLENSVGIYFDFNEPVITNTVFHTVDTGFLAYNFIDFIAENMLPAPVSIFPNPAGAWAHISSNGRFFKNGTIHISDVYGRQVAQQTFQGTSATLRRNGLPSGVYVIEVFENGVRAGAGRILWKAGN